MDYREFSEALFPALGLNPRRLHRRGVRRRVIRRMESLRIHEFHQYLEKALHDPIERQLLASLLTVTITRFFRDREVYSFLFETLLPEYLSNTGRGELRAWSAGCGGGEEPYSLAIYVSERLTADSITFSILATDINPACLQRAKEGIYSKSSFKEVPPELQEKYFTRTGDPFAIRANVKASVEFQCADITTFSANEAFDLILCRNSIFTYHLPEVQERAVKMFHTLLEPSGLLVIGQKEQLPRGTEQCFEAISSPLKIFRRRSK